MKKELVVHKEPKSPIAETFRTLRTNIQFMNTNRKLRTLLITSTFPGEGKSWVSSNLAVSFAQAGKKVIMVDADMRKGRQYSIFGVPAKPGLSNYLSGIDEENTEKVNIMNYIKETEVQNLYIMPSGNIPPNPSELLITPQMIELLERLKVEYDLVIIDGTPSKLVTDAVILSRIVDSTIIVTEHNQTKKDDLVKIVKDIKNVGGNIGGVVYNKIPVSNKKYNETYYYSSMSIKPSKKSQKAKLEYEYEESRKQKVERTANVLARDREPEKRSVILEDNIKRDIIPENSNSIVKEEMELPKAVQMNIDEKTSREKTKEVLREINEYLKNEKIMKEKMMKDKM